MREAYLVSRAPTDGLGILCSGFCILTYISYVEEGVIPSLAEESTANVIARSPFGLAQSLS